jgi:hypothetical protein
MDVRIQMPKAVVKNGVIYPLVPLSAECADGKEVWFDYLEADAPLSEQFLNAADEWYLKLEASVAQIDPKDYEIIENALKEADEIEKARMRHEMGL